MLLCFSVNADESIADKLYSMMEEENNEAVQNGNEQEEQEKKDEEWLKLLEQEEEWAGEFYKEYFPPKLIFESKEIDPDTSGFDALTMLNYEDYVALMSILNKKNSNMFKVYDMQDSNYIILYINGFKDRCAVNIYNYVEEDDMISIYGKIMHTINVKERGCIIVIPTKMPIGTMVRFVPCHTRLDAFQYEESETTAFDKNGNPLPDNLQNVNVNGKRMYQHNGNVLDSGYIKDYFNIEPWEPESIEVVDQRKITEKISNDFMEIMSYDEYSQFIDELEKVQPTYVYKKLDKNDESVNKQVETATYQKYQDKESNYLVLLVTSPYSSCDLSIYDIQTTKEKIIIYGDESKHGFMSSGRGCFVVIPTNMPAETQIEYIECYSNKEISNLRNYGEIYNPNEPATADKPIIYLYPKTETDVVVELKKPELIVCSYPKYESKWSVLAKPDGTLIDQKTGRKLYSLYYESKTEPINITDGFVVKGEDSDSFLEEKLALLGLTEREAEEFIVYWLPRLKSNPYNLIHFATREELDNYMPIEIIPKPDNFIRVWMIFEALDEPIEIDEQTLTSPERDGFVAVEWGGVENLKNKH